jgi:putative membrane protein
MVRKHELGSIPFWILDLGFGIADLEREALRSFPIFRLVSPSYPLRLTTAIAHGVQLRRRSVSILSLMPQFVVTWIVTAISLLITAQIVPGITINSIPAAIVGSAVFGLVNAIVKPILVIFTLPLTILTLGLFLLVVNAICFSLASYFTPSGFVVEGFWAALLGSIVLSLVSGAIDRLFFNEKE